MNVNVNNGAQSLTSCSQVADAALCNSEQCVNVNGNEQISSLSGLCPVSCGMCGVNFAGVSTLNTCVDTYVRLELPDSNGQTGTLNCQQGCLMDPGGWGTPSKKKTSPKHGLGLFRANRGT